MTGAAAPICVTPPETAVLPGEACGDDPTTEEVEIRPCLGYCIENRCAELCESDDDCDGGFECAPLGMDVDTNVDVCLPLPTCTSDGDCATGQVCRAQIFADGLRDVCGTPGGTLAPGDVCEQADPRFLAPDERCGVACLDAGEGPTSGRCTAICETDSDCPSELFCSHAAITVNGGGTPDDRSDDVVDERGICAFAPGSRSSCATDAACPSDERCVHLVDSAGAEQQWCITAIDGGRATGEICNDTLLCANRVGCFVGWFDPSERYCTAVCESDDDCPPELSCRVFTGAPDPDITPQLCLRPEDPRGEPL